MVRTPIILFALAALLLASGCSFKKGIGPKDSTVFGVNFALKEVEDCSGVSPEVELDNVPKDAKRVRLKFLNIEFGTTLFDNEFGFETTHRGLILKGGKATLPKGSIPDYQGPCAKAGAHTYSIEAQAKDGKGRELGTATSTQSTAGADGDAGKPTAPGPDAGATPAKPPTGAASPAKPAAQ